MRLLLPTAVSVALLFAVRPFSPAVAQSSPGTPYTFQFPQDLYDHPAFSGEWWYFTGNLTSLSGKPYGYELTFFRNLLPTGLREALQTPADRRPPLPALRLDPRESLDHSGRRLDAHRA